MENENDAVMKEMEETRSSLTEKLEALESKVAEKIAPVAEAVERVTEAAAEIVEGVKDTVFEVTGKVEDTVNTVSSAFNLREQVDKHPWLTLALAGTAGCMIGNLTGRAGQSPQVSAPISPPSRLKHGKGTGNGRAGKSEDARDDKPFTEEFRRLESLAIAALMGVVRDLAKQVLPESIASRVSEELDDFTSRLGVEPIRGPVLGEARNRHADASGTDQERRKSFPSETETPSVTGTTGYAPALLDRI